MPREPFKIIGSYAVDRDVVINGQQTINMYEVPSPVNKEGSVLVPASGYENKHTYGSGVVRSQFVFLTNSYYVVGNTLFEVDTNLTGVNRGTLSTSTGYVSMTANVSQVVLADGVNIYVFDTTTNVFTTVPLPGILPTDISSLDGWIIAINGGSNDWYISALNNALVWNPSDRALFSSIAGDKLKGCHVFKRRLYLFGSISTEIWQDTGAADFPFRRDNNFLFEHGIAAPKTVMDGFEVMMYLATNQDGPAGVMLVDGVSNPRKVSDQYVDLFFQTVSNLSDSEAIFYRENGFIFYQLSLTTDDATFVYVLNTNKWHTLEDLNGDRHIATSHIYFNGKHYIGAYNSNAVYELSYLFLTNDGQLIKGIRQAAPVFDNTHRRIRPDRFELECIPGMPDGVGNNPSKYPQMMQLINTNTAPQIFLYISRDGGRTFGNQHVATLGTLGQFNARAIFRRLGVEKGRRLVFRIEYYYTTRFYIIGANWIYEVLPQ